MLLNGSDEHFSATLSHLKLLHLSYRHIGYIIHHRVRHVLFVRHQGVLPLPPRAFSGVLTLIG